MTLRELLEEFGVSDNSAELLDMTVEIEDVEWNRYDVANVERNFNDGKLVVYVNMIEGDDDET